MHLFYGCDAAWSPAVMAGAAQAAATWEHCMLATPPARCGRCYLRRVDSSIGHQRGDPQGGDPGQQHKPFSSITLQVAGRHR